MNEPTYEEIQREELTYEHVQRVKYELWSQEFDDQSARHYCEVHKHAPWIRW